MTTTEETRRQLFETVRDHLGEPAAEQLMAVTIPANTDLATRQDLVLVRQDLDLLRAELHVDMAELRGELRGEMAELRGEVQASIRRLRTDVGGELDAVRGRISALETQVGKLEEKVGALEKRLEAEGRAIRSELDGASERLRSYLLTRLLPANAAIVTAIVGIASWLS